jgi:hypothetical protein
MAILRYAKQGNATGAALVSALIVHGQDYTLKSIKRTLTAADVGANAGQTQHANGCLIAQFQGAKIKDVIHFSVFHLDGAEWNIIFDGKHNPADASHRSSIGWKLSADSSSLYVRDRSNNAATLLTAADYIQALIVLGND